MPKLLYMSMSGFYPEAIGGAQMSSVYLFNNLRRRGWQVEVICPIAASASYLKHMMASYLKTKLFDKNHMSFKFDRKPGFPCYRFVPDLECAQRVLKKRLEENRPDIVMGGHSMAILPFLSYTAQRTYPSFYFARVIDEFESDFIYPSNVYAIANAPKTALHLKNISKQDVPIILPMVDFQAYKIVEHVPRYITFINPVPQKGVHIATAVAKALPNEEFLFVKGRWGHYTGEETFLDEAKLLPNVKIIEPQSDMRLVYSQTDILFVPSQFEETAGRVILEAHINGIPVVASGVCGIPDQLGKGGILITPKDNIPLYIDALTRLRKDKALYKELSIAALENSKRKEFDPEYQVDLFEEFVLSRSVGTPVGV
jgi:glycosyltransferase involved in cell wall biosynthesis